MKTLLVNFDLVPFYSNQSIMWDLVGTPKEFVNDLRVQFWDGTDYPSRKDHLSERLIPLSINVYIFRNNGTQHHQGRNEGKKAHRLCFSFYQR